MTMRRWIRTAAALSTFLITIAACTGVRSPGGDRAPATTPPEPTLAWTANVGTHPSGVTVLDGVVYVTRAEGDLLAFPADCSSSPCPPSWTGRTGATLIRQGTGDNGLTTEFARPLASAEWVFVRSRDRRTLWAFEASCGSATCAPAWVLQDRHPIMGITTDRNHVFVGTWHGDVASYPRACGSSGQACVAEWRSSAVAPSWYLELDGDTLLTPGFDSRLHALDPASGTERWRSRSQHCAHCLSAPVVAAGQVYVTTALGALLDTGTESSLLFAYPIDCAGRECRPTWTATMPDLLPSNPVVGEDLIYVSSEGSPGSGDGHLYAFPTSCATEPCPASWSAPTMGETGIFPPVYADGVVITTSQEQGVVEAFPAGCGSSTCKALWFNDMFIGPLSPMVTDGMIYVATNDGVLLAFDLRCRDDGGYCDPSWQLPSSTVPGADAQAASGAFFTPPVVSAGMLYTTSADGTLYAYRVGEGTTAGT